MTGLERDRSAGAEGAVRSIPQPARGGWHVREWIAELLGTAVLLFGGLSAICVDFAPVSPVVRVLPSSGARLLVTGLLFAGSGSLVAVSPLGRLSGAHLNPAVTVAFWLRGHVHRHDLGGYLVAQSVGALLGVGTARLVWGRLLTAPPVSWGRTAPGHGLGGWQVAGIEAAMTAALILVIFGFVSSASTARWTPLAVWLLVAGLVWQVAPYTGTSLNPARTLAPDLWSGRFPALWAYVGGPLAGAILAVAAWTLVRGRETLTAKLFHDPRYPSTLRSVLPARSRR